jgi:hypothetical protein
MNRPVTATVLAISALGLAWLVAQNAPAPNSLSSLFPGGALVYVEARDLSALLRDWNTSQEKRLWLASSNYEVFSRTRLFMRLGEAQQQFAETAGFAPDMSLVNSIAGGQSAVAVYDIGELEFLYITRLPSARILSSTPFTARGAYESRESAGITYYVRSGANRRVAAFGSADGLLFLATRGDLVANALALHAQRQAVTSLAQDRWFEDVTRAARNPGEVRLALNMPGLLKTPYFRSYWVQRNASQLKPFSAGVIDLFREAREVREERLLIRESPAAAPSEQAVAQVIAWAPADAGLVRAWATPGSDAVAELIRTKLLQPGRPGGSPSHNAPIAANPDSIIGDSGDWETRIDQPPLASDATDAVATLRPVLESASIQAMLHVQSSRPAGDGVFIQNDSAIALLSANEWPAVSLQDVAVHRQGRILVLASSGPMLQSVVARLGVAPAAGAAYAARYSHARELTPFTRMMTQMDAAAGDRSGEGPQFFSQNVASLGRVLGRLDSASITVHDDGSRVAQQMIYRLKP